MRITGDAGEQILHDERHTAKRSLRECAGRLRACLLEARVDHRVQLGVELLDPRDRVVDELERRRLALAHELGLRGRIDERFRHGGLLRSGYACTDGRRSAHGCARSSAPATWNKRSSRYGAATNCTPTGSPAGDIASGTDIAG